MFGRLGFGLRFGGLRRGSGRGSGDLAQPGAGALHCRRVPRGLLLLADGLDALQGAQRGVLLARHGPGLGAAAAHLLDIVGREAGEAEAVVGVLAHLHDAHGEAEFEVILGVQDGDGVDRAPVARRAGLGRVGDRWRQMLVEEGADLTGAGAGDVGVAGVGVHEGLAPAGGDQGRWVLVWLMSMLVWGDGSGRCIRKRLILGTAREGRESTKPSLLTTTLSEGASVNRPQRR
jgi:hypothetical protein